MPHLVKNNMGILLRTISLVLLLISYVSGWYIVAGVIFVWYLFRYSGYELVIIAFILDAFYGYLTHLPIITLSVFMAWTMILMLRPKLLLYTHDNENVT